MQKVQTIKIPKGKIAEINLYITQTYGSEEPRPTVSRSAPPPPPDGPPTEWKGRTLPVAKAPEEEKVDPREAVRVQLVAALNERNARKRALEGSGRMRGGCFSKRCRC